MDDLRTIPVDWLPYSVRAMIRANHDGSTTIVTNAHLSVEMQKAAALHEYKHLINGDLYSDKSVGAIESQRHQETKSPTPVRP